MSIVVKILVISLTVGVVVMVGNSFLSPHYRYDDSFDAQKAMTMPIGEASDYVQEHAIKRGTVEYLVQVIQIPSYLLRVVAPYFITALLSCLALSLWTRRSVTPTRASRGTPAGAGAPDA